MTEKQRTFAVFYDDIHDAVGSAVQALGGPKKVAAWLWPNKKLDTAYAHLKNCLRDDKPEKLDPHELLLIAKESREVGEHAIAEYFCAFTGYESPRPQTPEDELTELLRAHNQLAEKLLRINQKIERNQTQLKAVG